ncbi:MAG: adhesin [Candidatus Electrothrix sp. GM3_4]|nr:adhesin [Candidatus Electrothrix sp. GM3_4]
MLEVTETAITNVKEYLRENNIESAVRIVMMSGGCSGSSLGLALDEAKENDLTFQQEGVNFLVKKSLAETCGTITVDFMDTTVSTDTSGSGCSGGGFSIKSENSLSGDEKGGCGCSCTSGSCG